MTIHELNRHAIIPAWPPLTDDQLNAIQALLEDYCIDRKKCSRYLENAVSHRKLWYLFRGCHN